MANQLPPSPALVISRSPIVNKDGTASWEFVKILQDWSTRITSGLNQLGQFIGQLTQQTQISGRGANLGTIIQNVDDSGVITANGVDFARPYVNKNTDHINDGTGNPLAGGRTAYQALIASGPATGRALVFSGSTWTPQQVQYSNVSGTPTIPANAPSTAHEWIASYNSATGIFTQTQPSFADLIGTATAGQVPALSGLSGQITTAQLPAAGISGTVTLAKLTTGGANGSLTITNGIITAVTNPT